MPYYVPLGIRGVVLRVGTALIGVLGGLTYWWSSRKRDRLGRDSVVSLRRNP